MTVLAPAAPASAAAGDTFTGPVSTALSQLATSTEVRTGYDRTLFPHWKDEDGDGCHTRNEVLIEEAAVRQSFANDLGDARSVVVTDNVNQSKGDQDPATWSPRWRSAATCASGSW